MRRCLYMLGLVALMLCIGATTASAAYEFTVDIETGFDYKIGWTDGIGNRLGQPLFEGSTGVDTFVKRSTSSDQVEDHYTVCKPLGGGSGGTGSDTHHGDDDLGSLPPGESWEWPENAVPGGGSTVFMAVDLEQWGDNVCGNGPHTVVAGVSATLPGFLVVTVADDHDFEDAFDVNTSTGQRTLKAAGGASLYSGSLVEIGCANSLTSIAVPAVSKIGFAILTLLMLGAIAVTTRQRGTARA